MDRTRIYVVFMVIALIAGIMLPMLLQYSSGGLGAPSYIPVYTPVTVPGYDVGTGAPPGYVGGFVRVEGGAFKSYGELLETLKSVEAKLKLVESLKSLLWAPGITLVRPLIPTGAPAAVPEAPKSVAPSVSEPRVSWTNVQVPGVDEPDVVKTDGRLVFVASQSNSRVYVVDARGKTLLYSLDFRGELVKGLLVNGGRLIVITESKPMIAPLTVSVQERVVHSFLVPSGTSNTSLYIVEVPASGTPNILLKVPVTGSELSSRMLGDTVYIVTTQPAITPGGYSIPLVGGHPVRPESIYVADPEPTTYATLLALNVTSLEYTAASILIGGASRLYMSLDRLYVISQVSPSIAEASMLLLAKALKVMPEHISKTIESKIAEGDIAGGLNTINKHLSEVRLEEAYRIVDRLKSSLEEEILEDKTIVYAFNVKGLQLSYKGKAEAEGSILDQFAIEEYKGHLIIATTTTRYKVAPSLIEARAPTPWKSSREPSTVEIVECRVTCITRTTTVSPMPVEPPIREKHALTFTLVLEGPSSNSVYTIELESFKIVGELKDLAPNERVYAARLVKNILYLVTFRVVDPLFAIDVSDVKNPRVLGYLKIPGFSEYLHPLPNDMLLGVGLDEGNTLKISLFDVRDPTNMSEISKVLYRGAWSLALSDHHAITVDLEYETAYIPIRLYVPGLFSYKDAVTVVSYKGGALNVKSLLEHMNVLRALYIGRELFTVSENLINVYDIESLNIIASIVLE
ncbi:MAG: beta-propeller domain-containing protein [Thermoprotei archaeon]|nr:beta-propeller domain-containing protein [Thermoprotei archaeon]